MEFDADLDFAVRDTRSGRDGEDRVDKPVGGRLYVAMPDTGALRQLVSLWERYQAGQRTRPSGFGPWFEVFRTSLSYAGVGAVGSYFRRDGRLPQ